MTSILPLVVQFSQATIGSEPGQTINLFRRSHPGEVEQPTNPLVVGVHKTDGRLELLFGDDLPLLHFGGFLYSGTKRFDAADALHLVERTIPLIVAEGENELDPADHFIELLSSVASGSSVSGVGPILFGEPFAEISDDGGGPLADSDVRVVGHDPLNECPVPGEVTKIELAAFLAVFEEVGEEGNEEPVPSNDGLNGRSFGEFFLGFLNVVTEIDGFVVDFGFTAGISVFIDTDTDTPQPDGAIFRRCR